MRRILCFSFACLLAGCGLVEMPKKMDKTNDSVDGMSGKMDHTNGGLDDMNKKVDKTNGGLDEMNKKVDETNNGLEGMNKKVDKTNDGLDEMNTKVDKTNSSLDATNVSITATNNNLLAMLDQIREMNVGMGTMNTGMQTTNAALHNQILLVALQEMTKPENTLVLTPPTAMMPSGKKFAEEASAQDILELTHAWMNEYNLASLDKNALKDAGYTDADIARMQADLTHQKQAKLEGLQVINGFLPQATVAKLVDEVQNNGRYRGDALAAMTMRALFVQQILLQGDLLAGKVAVYGQMLDAAQYMGELDYLGRLPFASKISFTTQTDGEVKFAAKETLSFLYADLDSRFDTDLDTVYTGGTPSTDPTIKTQAEQLKALRVQIKENLQYWNDQP